MQKKICKDCFLYNKKESVCSVSILYEGEKYEMPVKEYDYCFWETIEEESEKLNPNEEGSIEIKQIRIWSDGKNGYIES